MSKRGIIQRVIGVALLVVLVAPVIMLSVPQTHTEIVFHEVRGPGMVTMIEPEYVEITYIPLVSIIRYSAITLSDVALFIVYGGLFALAIWLVVHSRKHRLKEA